MNKVKCHAQERRRRGASHNSKNDECACECVIQTLRGVFSFIAMYSWRSETDIIRLIREKSV